MKTRDLSLSLSLSDRKVSSELPHLPERHNAAKQFVCLLALRRTRLPPYCLAEFSAVDPKFGPIKSSRRPAQKSYIFVIGAAVMGLSTLYLSTQIKFMAY